MYFKAKDLNKDEGANSNDCKCKNEVAKLMERIANQNAQLTKLNQLIGKLENKNN